MFFSALTERFFSGYSGFPLRMNTFKRVLEMLRGIVGKTNTFFREHIVTSLTFSFNILIPQLVGHAVKRPSQFSRCACQEKKSEYEVNSGELREF